VPKEHTSLFPGKTIRGIPKHIAQKFASKQLIIFGSWMYGNPTAANDEHLLKDKCSLEENWKRDGKCKKIAFCA
jgi:hypothetical protein